MAFSNLISITFTDEELQQLDNAIAIIERLLEGKTINLTPEERQQYGSIAQQNKLFVNKAKEYMEQYPQHVPAYLDKGEFDRDYTSRFIVEMRLDRLEGIAEQLSDTKVLLDHDNYHNAISFYRNIRYLSEENVAGTTSIYEGMRQFFGPGSSPEAAKGNAPSIEG